MEEGSQHEDLQNRMLELDNQIKLCGRCENMMEIYPKYSLQVMLYYQGQPMYLLKHNLAVCHQWSLTSNMS